MLLANGGIYLDYNATTPIDPQVVEAMQPYLHSNFGNPSSSHELGRQSLSAIQDARLQIAGLLRCEPNEIIFTSGGSESNNLALKGITHKHAHKGMHVIISAVEHPSISNVCQYLMVEGFRVSFLPVNSRGVIDPAELDEIITSKTLLVSVMHANNEVGSIQPIRELSDIAHDAGAIFHTDVAQSVSKIPVHVDELGCDLMSVASHKMYGPKGVGILYSKKGLTLEPIIHGASQEAGKRAGTENVASIVGMGKAAELVMSTLTAEMEHLAMLRDRLQTDLKEAFPQMRVNAAAAKRLPNTLSISFKEVTALQIIENLPDIYLSMGAACHRADGKGSGVLEAMGVPLEYQLGTLRMSLGRFSDESQIALATGKLVKTITYLLNH